MDTLVFLFRLAVLCALALGAINGILFGCFCAARGSPPPETVRRLLVQAGVQWMAMMLSGIVFFVCGCR